ncbi:hypothetical protein NKJ71_13930 [Mesorhizobium sp. M0050]|uniref:hypothetical protein n=1 Tax=Mesorhizobium sp. M0050 TaxID=2956861 RepID=UPI003335B0CF
MTAVGNITFGPPSHHAFPPRHWDSVARRYVEHDTLPQETFGEIDGGIILADAKARQVGLNLDGSARRETVDLGAVPAANDNQYDPNTRFGDFIQTFTGKQFWPMDPRASDVDILDVAHALSMQTRYAGHCLQFYSVAEHSVHMAAWLTRRYDAKMALCGLLHDATEAYLCDVPRPVKPHLVGYKAAEENVWVKAIAPAFDLPLAIPAAVHEADSRILLDERAQNMSPATYVGGWPDAEPLGVQLKFWPPGVAEIWFLDAYRKLTAEVRAAA